MSIAPPKADPAPPTRRRTLSGRTVPFDTPRARSWLELVAPGPKPLISAKLDHLDVQHPLNERKGRRVNRAKAARVARRVRRWENRVEIATRLETPAPSAGARRALVRYFAGDVTQGVAR